MAKSTSKKREQEVNVLELLEQIAELEKAMTELLQEASEFLGEDFSCEIVVACGYEEALVDLRATRAEMAEGIIALAERVLGLRSRLKKVALG